MKTQQEKQQKLGQIAQSIDGYMRENGVSSELDVALRLLYSAHDQLDQEELCDECSGTRSPAEKHDDHCSLNPKNSVG